jgi:hypothetical protein
MILTMMMMTRIHQPAVREQRSVPYAYYHCQLIKKYQNQQFVNIAFVFPAFLNGVE